MIRLSLSVLAVVIPSIAVASFTQSIAIPAYFYPSSPPDPVWTQMDDAYPTVGIAIMNPASGPGAVVDPNYSSQVAITRGKGVRVLGYVDTSYATRSASAVQADIDAYYSMYPVDGIFLDQASNDCADQAYYASLDTYVKAKGGLGITIINPGTVTPECYASAADVILNFEGSYADYQTWTPLGWEAGYAAARFWHLIYATSEANVPSVVLQSQSYNAGYVYVTPDTLVNPWDTLPPETYWSTELAYVRPSGSCSTPVVEPRLILSKLDTAPGDDGMRFGGVATFSPLAVIDPAATGARLIIDDSASTVADITLPAGDYAGSPGFGWKTNGAGSAWAYLNKTASPPGGLVRLKVRRSDLTPGQVKFGARAKNGSFAITPANLPASAALIFSATDPTAACAHASFPGPEPACSFSSGGRTLRCK